LRDAVLIAPDYAEAHAGFLERCAEAGQSRSTPILLRFRAPAVNHLHRDVWGRLAFPVQLAVTLSPLGRDHGGFEGGAFILADEAAGRSAVRREIVCDRGDAVIFCTRDRPIRIGTAHARQPVFHGTTPITAGERYVLGCPFHEYK
jgi:hypothetical protein